MHADCIAASSIAPVGTRSEADFAVCCHAIRNGIAKEETWGQVEHVGKFAEQGRRYFDLTWENAEYDVRASKLDKLEKRTAPKGPQGPVRSDEVFGDDAGDLDQSAGGRFTILVDPQTMQVGETLHQVTDRLLSTGHCFSRADKLVVVSCCIRAGFDCAVKQSMGVIGFTAADIRRMFPKGVPDWVKNGDWETIGVKAVVPGVGFVPDPTGEFHPFDAIPDEAGIWI